MTALPDTEQATRMLLGEGGTYDVAPPPAAGSRETVVDDNYMQDLHVVMRRYKVREKPCPHLRAPTRIRGSQPRFLACVGLAQEGRQPEEALGARRAHRSGTVRPGHSPAVPLPDRSSEGAGRGRYRHQGAAELGREAVQRGGDEGEGHAGPAAHPARGLQEQRDRRHHERRLQALAGQAGLPAAG